MFILIANKNNRNLSNTPPKCSDHDDHHCVLYKVFEKTSLSRTSFHLFTKMLPAPHVSDGHFKALGSESEPLRADSYC